MHLNIIEDTGLSEKMNVLGVVIFDDCNIQSKDKGIVIRNAKRGTMYIDPRVYYERTLGTVNYTIAHECYHWHRHQPYQALMKMIGADSTLGKSIQYSLNRTIRDAIDAGKVVYVDGHVCINDKRYVRADEEGARLTAYALTHIDECCLVFDKGYSYESQYQGKKMYTQMMYMTPTQPAAQEYSFELNKHNKTLLAQIGNAKRSADAMRLYPGGFGETLAQMMKARKLSNKKLADASLVGEKTIQRLRNNEEYPTSVQTVVALCFGLKLTVPEADMLLEKTDFNIRPTIPQNNAYRTALGACGVNTIYEINEMLKYYGYESLGGSKTG